MLALEQGTLFDLSFIEVLQRYAFRLFFLGFLVGAPLLIAAGQYKIIFVIVILAILIYLIIRYRKIFFGSDGIRIYEHTDRLSGFEKNIKALAEKLAPNPLKKVAIVRQSVKIAVAKQPFRGLELKRLDYQLEKTSEELENMLYKRIDYYEEQLKNLRELFSEYEVDLPDESKMLYEFLIKTWESNLKLEHRNVKLKNLLDESVRYLTKIESVKSNFLLLNEATSFEFKIVKTKKRESVKIIDPERKELAKLLNRFLSKQNKLLDQTEEIEQELHSEVNQSKELLESYLQLLNE